MVHYGDIHEDETIYMVWGSYDGGTGASITQTGLIAGDVKIFKDGGVAEKASTDGITVSNDFDTRTGLHLISIDTSNDTGAAGFWVAQAEYQVAIDAVTIDGQTVRFWVGSFSIENRPADLTRINTVAQTATLDDIEAQTDDIGVAGAGLTAVPWNSAWDAQVESEVADALAVFWTSPATLVDLIWNEVITGHAVADSFGLIFDQQIDGLRAYGDAGWATATGFSTFDPTVTGVELLDSGGAVGTSAAELVVDIWAAATRDITGGTIDTVGDKTGYALSAAGVDAIWDEVITGHAVADSFGLIFDQQIDGLRAYGDAGWATATGFSTHAAADVWTAGTRTLTALGFVLANADAGWVDANDRVDVGSWLGTAVTVSSTTAKPEVDMNSISDDATAADILEGLMEGILLVQVNDASATTTDFAADGFTEATDDHFNGRLITFVTGILTGQQTDITDYDAAGGVQGSQQFTVTALTEAPGNNDWFVIH
jgi:hypothetical protein